MALGTKIVRRSLDVIGRRAEKVVTTSVEQAVIPKIFHLTSKSKKLSSTVQSNVDVIKALYPDYKILIHDDDDIVQFIKKNYPEYYESTISQMPKFIWVVDTVRYLLMDHCGGIYCDTDVLFRKRFEFDAGVIFIEREWTWPNDHSIINSVHNCLFASEPKHPVWTEILDGITQNVRSMQRPTAQAGRFTKRVVARLLGKSVYPLVFDVTGPNAISKIITQNGSLRQHKDIRVFPGNQIFQAGMSKGTVEEASFVHGAAGSWQ